MNLRLEMLSAARRGPKLLGASTGLVRQFLLTQQNPDGGFKNRAGHSDLYYLPFGLAGLAALGEFEANPESSARLVENVTTRAVGYLTTFGAGPELDFVHLCCLARSWAALQDFSQSHGPPLALTPILARLELHRTPDGGYNPVRDRDSGTAYGALLALGAYEDLDASIPEPDRLTASLASLQTVDGGYANELYAGGAHLSPDFNRVSASASTRPSGFRPASGSTNATAAAVAALRHLGAPVGHCVGEWLLARAHAGGGFVAAVNSPVPDLLSTATALHALAALRAPLEAVRERCLDFVDSLWTNAGGFYGHWGDDVLDVEYAFYGLLALGNLDNQVP